MTEQEKRRTETGMPIVTQETVTKVLGDSNKGLEYMGKTYSEVVKRMAAGQPALVDFINKYADKPNNVKDRIRLFELAVSIYALLEKQASSNQ